jgi:hypothetical protein
VSQLHTRDAVRQPDGPRRAGLEIVFNTRHIPTVVFDDLSDLSHAAQAMVAKIERHPDHFRLPARSPDWIAARLWECRREVEDTEVLHRWVDQWRLLSAEPLGAPANL